MQRLEHLPIDQCFGIYGQSTETIRYTPPVLFTYSLFYSQAGNKTFPAWKHNKRTKNGEMGNLN